MYAYISQVVLCDHNLWHRQKEWKLWEQAAYYNTTEYNMLVSNNTNDMASQKKNVVSFVIQKWVHTGYPEKNGNILWAISIWTL